MYDIVLRLGGASAFWVLVIVGFLTIVYWTFSRSQIFRMWSTNANELNAGNELSAGNGPNAGNGLNVGNLSNELIDVTAEWYQLGIKLGIQHHELKNIEKQYQDVYRQLTETLVLWLQQTPNASWGNVVKALQDMRKNTLAERIRNTYIREASKNALAERMHHKYV